MALPPPTSPRFLKVGTELVRLHCLTRVYPWVAHYDPVLRLAVRCAGEYCGYCDAGRTPELRFVIGCYSDRAGRVLFEMRERHRGVASEMDEHCMRGVGFKLQVHRTGTAINSPIEVSVVDWVEADEWDISKLVDALGLIQSGKKSEVERSSHEGAIA